MIGTTISHYRVLGTAGVGGMGVVYLAEDTRLNRKVALKFLPPAIALDDHARGRLLREAQAASALDHPNVATIYEIGEWQNQLFIAMAFYDGETLRQRIERGPVGISEAASVLLQLATGLSAAHRAGIVHRDLKPANVMLTHDGHVKILDFGLAKMLSDSEQTALRLTGPNTTIGTVAYMAPEQAHSAEVDARADIWALGVMGFEMLTGRLPFNATTPTAALLSVARDVAPAIRSVRPDVPEEIAALVDGALEKSPARRTVTADTVVAAVSAWQTRSSSAMSAAPAASGSAIGRVWIAAAAIVLIATAAAFGWYVRQQSRARWARETALPEIERLVEREQYVAAFALMNDAKRYIATDPVWARLDPIVWHRVSVVTTPPGAMVSYRDYTAPDATPTILGPSPVTGAPVPNSPLAWRVEKQGFETAEDVTGPQFPRLAFTLSERGQSPGGMVHASVGDAPYQMYIPGLDHLPAVKLRDFWIDRYEVSNREFKKFVDDGGYRRRELWQAPFVKDGRELGFDEAVRLFTDSTGRPGPATWEQGRFPEGQDDLPVTGVSWFEAAAYAAYAGKSLPTIYHWSRAAEQRFSGFVVPRSNFSGRGATKVGASGAMSRFGTVDMPGNVKEWCWNRADASRRYILGGAWDEPVYMANDPDARSPFERANNFGFRCVKYSQDESLASAGAELVAFEARDFSKETPVNDQGFELIRRMHAYDRSDLKPASESVDDSNADWRIEKISFAAAYGNERVPAFLFLPKSAKPPYQTVVFFPGSNVIQQRSSGPMPPRIIDFVIKSGRALIYPVYKGTFERSVPTLTSDYPNPTNAFRELVFDWAKDVRRSVDYLETRPDIDSKSIAFMGLSWGAAMGPIYVALEPRFKACVLIVGGFYLQHSAPEVDAFNFAPRVHVPVLLLNGRFDFFYPMDTSQLPMFRLFGVPEAQKRRVIYDTGHNIPRPELIRETLDWLDRWVGPVKPVGGRSPLVP
jgi:predicted esterase